MQTNRRQHKKRLSKQSGGRCCSLMTGIGLSLLSLGIPVTPTCAQGANHAAVQVDSTLLNDTTSAQPIVRNYYRATIGGGIASFPSGGLGGGILLTFQRSSSVFTIGYQTYAPLNIFGSSEEQSVEEWDILYGRAYVNDLFFASISAGLSFNSFYLNSSMGQFRRLTSIGVPVQAELMFDPDPFVGLGLMVFANLNTAKSYGGILFCLQIGWF